MVEKGHSSLKDLQKSERYFYNEPIGHQLVFSPNQRPPLPATIVHLLLLISYLIQSVRGGLPTVQSVDALLDTEPPTANPIVFLRSFETTSVHPRMFVSSDTLSLSDGVKIRSFENKIIGKSDTILGDYPNLYLSHDLNMIFQAANFSYPSITGGTRYFITLQIDNQSGEVAFNLVLLADPHPIGTACTLIPNTTFVVSSGYTNIFTYDISSFSPAPSMVKNIENTESESISVLFNTKMGFIFVTGTSKKSQIV